MFEKFVIMQLISLEIANFLDKLLKFLVILANVYTKVEIDGIGPRDIKI